MLSIPLYLFFAGITVWGFFEPNAAGWIFFGMSTLFGAWLFLASRSLKTKWILNLNKDLMSKDEIDIFKKYPFYFIYPYQAKQYSSTISLIQVLSIIWFGLGLWHRDWMLITCIAGLFFGATNMAPILNQGNFLRHHNKRGNLTPELQTRLALVESVESKILEARMKKWTA